MTAQIHEELILNGEKTSMAFCPPLPDEHPRIVKVSLDEAMQDSDSILFSTACWRAYQGSWEIRDGRFYLVGLRGTFRLLGEDPIVADWFSGVLRIPKGKVIRYIHMGFGSVFEQEVHVKVEKGVATSSRLVDNRGKKLDERLLG